MKPKPKPSSSRDANLPVRPALQRRTLPIRVKITATANDYITVKRVDRSGAETGSEFNVAKPEQLRHDAAFYPPVDNVSGSGQEGNAMTATGGGNTEEWEVRPWKYEAGRYLTVAPTGFSGVSVGGNDLKWIDLNVDGRAWADTTGNVGSAVSS